MAGAMLTYKFRLVASLCCLSLLTACGGSGKSSPATSIINPPPVQAASGFTNSSITGTYAFGVSGTSTSGAEGGTGIAAVDGNGNITAGDETVNIGGISCHLTFSGTYSINSNGTGSATITSTPDAASQARGCTGGNGTLSLAIGNGGNGLILASQSATAVTVTSAFKQ